MSEEATTPPDGGDTVRLAGQRLADARLAREIPIEDIARELHLDEYKVRALEQNNFEALGAPVFAKGYLRKYAALVGIPVDDILADYYRMNSPVSTPLVIPHRIPPPREISPGPWLGGIAVVVIVAGASWWWLSGGEEWLDDGTGPAALAPFVEDQSSEPQPAVAQPQAASQPPAEEAGTQEPEPLAEEPPPEDAAQDRSTEEIPSAGEDQVELRVTFSGDCWTEVTDAAGDRLFFGLGSEGRSITVTGEAPLQLLLGNSANASLQVNGSNYPIPVAARRGDTARLTIVDI